MESKCHNFLNLAKIHFSKIYIIHIYIYVYKSFTTTLDKGLRKNIKKDGETGEHKLSEMGALTMK